MANDGQPNQLWINQRDGTFKNTGLLSGTALSAHGKAKAGMGVDAGDFDNDGDEDLFVTNLTGEGNDLYVNDGSGLFEEQSARSGLGGASRGYTGFGTAWFDIDNDGWLDTLTVNGAVQTIEALRRVNDPFPLHQRKLLFRNPGANSGTARFEDVTARGGAAFELSEVGRGAAFGDIDNDGDVDVLVANNNGQPGCSSTTSAAAITGSDCDSWAPHRAVTTETCSAPASASSVTTARRCGAGLDRMEATRRPTIRECSWALANRQRASRVRVVWPSGTTEEWSSVAIDRYTTLTEGGGK